MFSVLSRYTLENFVWIAITVALVMFSAIVHEVAHGWVALKCGDATAKEAGRLTLNPAAHLDGFGSILLPLIMAVIGGPIFAFAKPVPYNPRRLGNPRRDEVLVALAGPVSNLLQAIIGALLFAVAFYGGFKALEAGYLSLTVLVWILDIITTYMYVNLVLCFFNLIPLPPLDGSKLILPLLHGQARVSYLRIQRYSMAILIAVLYLVPYLFYIDPLGIYLDLTAGNLYNLLITLV